MNPRKQLLRSLTLLGFLVGVAPVAEAIPAFARKHDMACNQCHSAWPLLNKTGRTFKENGFRLDREPATASKADSPDITIDDQLTLGKSLPMSLRFQGRPMVKRKTDPRFDMQVIHEVELEIANAAPKDFSYYVNLEAADDGAWAMDLVDVAAGWHPREGANFLAGYSRMGFSDGYNAFGSRRLTQDRPSPNSAGFQSGFRFRDGNQFMTFYGRVKALYYSATVGTGQGDTLGADKKDYLLRAAYDLPGGLSVGAFTLIGDRELTSPVRTQDYTRRGVDLQYDGKAFSANGVWYQAKEDLATTLVPQKNDAWYVQAHYVIPAKIPIVPTLRYESVESSNGTASTRAVTAALLAYVRGNINVSFDYAKQTKVPGTAAKTYRYSVLSILAF